MPLKRAFESWQKSGIRVGVGLVEGRFGSYFWSRGPVSLKME